MDSKSYDELLAECKNYMIANQSKITDFNTGSVIMTIFEALSRVVERGYEDTRLGYDAALIQMAFSIFNFEKKAGTYATVKVVFSASSAVTSAVTIPSGTKVSNGSYTFVTTAATTISAGNTDSDEVGATAESIGVAYNVAAGTITTIESTVPSLVVAVTNSNSATGGSDAESQTDSLIRFRKMLNGLQGTNYYGMESAILAVDGVKSVGIVEHIPPTEDEGYYYNATAYIDDGTGSLSDDLKEEVQKTIDGNDTDDYPGVRPAGINVNVKAAVDVEISVSATLYIDSSSDQEVMQAAAISAIQEYISGLGINENVVWSQVMNVLLGVGVKDVKNLLLNDSQENITISKMNVARYSSATFTMEYEE